MQEIYRDDQPQVSHNSFSSKRKKKMQKMKITTDSNRSSENASSNRSSENDPSSRSSENDRSNRSSDIDRSKRSSENDPSKRSAENDRFKAMLVTTLKMNILSLTLLVFVVPRQLLNIYYMSCYQTAGGCEVYLKLLLRISFMQVCVTFVHPFIVLRMIDKIH